MFYASRKIFFLYPGTEHENRLMEFLVRCEFEAHPVYDQDMLFKGLCFYDHSIVCINTEAAFKEGDVSQSINILRDSPDISDAVTCVYSLKNGVVTFDTERTTISIPAQSLDIGTHEGMQVFCAMLEAANARGRRKYIRAKCSGPGVSHVGVEVDDEFYTGRILDVSRVGISCSFRNMQPVDCGKVIRGVHIRLNNTRITCECVASGHRLQEKELVMILLFRSLDTVSAQLLGDYIYESLQNQFHEVMSTLNNLYALSH